MSHGDEGGGGSERWLLSYSDFITLLMVLFVILYSMGQTDVKRYKQLAGSLRAAFSGNGPERVVDPMINQSASSDDNSPSPIVISGIPSSPLNSQEVAGQLTSLLSASGLGGSVSVQNNLEGVLISLSEKLVFAPGTAKLQADAFPVLDTVAVMIKNLDNEIRIIGHTDNIPPSESKYKDNWELSTARAATIADYLISKGVLPQRITLSGQGEYRPLFPNDTSEHRLLNGRAEIVVVYTAKSELIDTGISNNALNSNQQPAATLPPGE
jgi:chemotaxis protein MotB